MQKELGAVNTVRISLPSRSLSWAVAGSCITMLIFTSLFCYLTAERLSTSKRRNAIKQIVDAGGQLVFANGERLSSVGPTFIDSDTFGPVFQIRLEGQDAPTELSGALREFPETRSLWICGNWFGDKDVEHLNNMLQLEVLYLKNTRVSLPRLGLLPFP